MALAARTTTRYASVYAENEQSHGSGRFYLKVSVRSTGTQPQHATQKQYVFSEVKSVADAIVTQWTKKKDDSVIFVPGFALMGAVGDVTDLLTGPLGLPRGDVDRVLATSKTIDQQSGSGQRYNPVFDRVPASGRAARSRSARVRGCTATPEDDIADWEALASATQPRSERRGARAATDDGPVIFSPGAAPRDCLRRFLIDGFFGLERPTPTDRHHTSLPGD